MDDFRLFSKSLHSYHVRCIQKDLPVNLINPILIQIEFLLGELNYSTVDVETRILLLCKRIEKLSFEDCQLKAYLMYNVIRTIDEKNDYLINFKGDIIRASSVTSLDSEQDEFDEYWLTAWRPSRIMSDTSTFEGGLAVAKLIWLEESSLLRSVLYRIVFQPPFDKEPTWDILRS